MQMSVKKCPGCEDKLFSPVLHLHNQLSLLDKMKNYFETVRASLLTSLDALYEQFESKLPHSDDEETDRHIYTNNARIFLITASPETIYYGRYMNDMIDSYINEAFKVKRKKRGT